MQKCDIVMRNENEKLSFVNIYIISEISNQPETFQTNQKLLLLRYEYSENFSKQAFTK